MSKPTKLSHSAIDKYMRCPKSFDYHYNKRLREKTRSGALIFGNAMDVPLDGFHLGKKENMYEVFDEAFENATVSGREKEYIPTNEDIVYSSKDFDKDLLQKEDLVLLEELAEDYEFDTGNLIGLVKFIADQKKEKGWANLSSRQRKYYNAAHWLSLRRKGHLMIDAYMTEVVPYIDKVLAVQKEVNIKNDDGDEIVGYLDLVVKLKDGRTVVLDRKTSSIEYEEDSVLFSGQLALYISAVEEEYKTRNAGYIVLYKHMEKDRVKICNSCGFKADKGSRHKTCSNETNSKRCNGNWNETVKAKCRIDVIIDEVPKRAEEIVIENFDEANHLIKQGVFTRNFNSCQLPWGKCPFFGICWKNDDSNLVVLPPIDREGKK